MAITFTTTPQGPVLTKNPVRFTFGSDIHQITAGVEHIHRMQMSAGSLPADGDSFTLQSSVMSGQIAFNCQASPSTFTSFLPAGSTPLEEYIDQVLVPVIAGHPEIHAHYTVYRIATQVVIKAKSDGPDYDLTLSTNGFTVNPAVIGGATGQTLGIQIRARIALAKSTNNTEPIHTEWSIFDPDEDGNVEWDISKMIAEMWDRMDEVDPGLSNYHRHQYTARDFYVIAAEHYGADPWATPETYSEAITAIQGGFSSYDWDQSFAAHYVTGSKWLTHRISPISTQPQMKDMLSLFTTSAFDSVDVELHAEVFYTDGTSQAALIWTENPMPTDALVTIPIGFVQLQLDLIDATKTPHRYQIWMQTDTGTILMPRFTVLLDDTHFLNFAIWYRNSFGCPEVLPCEGPRQRQATAARSVATTKRPGDAATDSREVSHAISTRPIIEVSTGPLAPNQAQCIDELMLSGEHMLISSEKDNARQLAARIVPKTLVAEKMATDNNGCYQYKLTFELEPQQAFSAINWKAQ